MSNGIEQAAEAFSRDIGGMPERSPAGIRDSARAPEAIFSNSDASEDDIIAGGDDEPRSRRSQPQPDDEREYMFAGDDEDPQPVDEDVDDQDGEDVDDQDDEDEMMSREFTVMVDGEEETITLREALDRGIRTKTFHKRLNQLDKAKKDLTGYAERIVADRQRHDTMLAEAEEILKSIVPAEPDWDKLFAEDPAAARNLQKQYDDLKGRVDQIRAKRAETQREFMQQQHRDKIEYARSEFPKFATYAKWRDKADMDKDIASMRKTALSAGFDENEIADVIDSRMLKILHKASKYDRMMAAKPKPVKSGKTPVNPGAGSRSTAHRGVVGAERKLARTGSVEDAAAVFARKLQL